MAEEEASTPKVKAAPKAGAKKAAAKTPKPAGPGAIAAGGISPSSEKDYEKEEPESFEATGLDNALDLLDVVTAKTDKASVGQQAAGLERHPEVRILIHRFTQAVETDLYQFSETLQGNIYVDYIDLMKIC